jgi:hypothetical protein
MPPQGPYLLVSDLETLSFPSISTNSKLPRSWRGIDGVFSVCAPLSPNADD